MSRRHAPILHPSQLARALGVALVLLVTLSATLPAAATAQGDKVKPRDLEVLWQLLEYRDADGDMQPVPPGIGATLLPFAGVIKGEAACSSYQASFNFTQASQEIFIEPPEIKRVDCDPAAQAVDDAFYSALNTRPATVSLAGSILTLRDAVEDPLLTLTRASIPPDPTIARWELARIGHADGSIGPVIQGVGPWIEFLRGGRVVGSTGCGSFLGSYATNDSTIRITDVDHRLEGCTEPVQQQASDIIGTLSDITDFEVLPAGLTLEDSNGSTRLALVPAIELGNRTWTPIEILGADGEINPVSDRLNTSSVRFAGGKADGNTYCRSYDGKSLVSGLALSTATLETFGGICPKAGKKGRIPPQEIEDEFLNALERVSSHALRGSELELLDVAGNPVMRLVPQAELVGPTWVVFKMDKTPLKSNASLRVPVQGTGPMTATFLELKVVIGDTGAGDNGYDSEYKTGGANRIEIMDVAISGRACKKSTSKLCRQEQAFKALLMRADRFIPRDDDLRLFKGTRPLIMFVPETVESAEALN